MSSLSPGSTLIWFLAEFEATAGHYPETTAWHFVMACFKLCDLDVGEFLRHAPEEAQNKREEIVGDAKGLKEQASRTCDAVATARRRLREALGKGRQGDAEAPLHRTAEARAVFDRAATLDHYSPEFGARPMERAVESLIAQPLAKAILEGRGAQGGELLARASGTKVTFE